MTDALVWITGASSGIGAALAASVPLRDAHVFDISRSGGAPTAGAGIHAPEHVPADLADPAAWAAVEGHLVAQLGGFSGSHAVFVHNAGVIDPIGPAGRVASEAYRRSVLLNGAAPQALGHAFLRAVDGFDGRAHLLLLSSGAASTPYEGWSAYCAGKAAVDQWVRTVGLEQEARHDGVQVLAISPGVVATPMQERIRATDEAAFPHVQRFKDLHDAGELRDADQVAAEIWSLLDRDIASGTVVDLRSLR